MFMSLYKMRLRSILIIVALAALVMAGVVTALRRPGRPYSTVFQRFDPAAIFSIHPGVSVDAVTGTGSFNKRLGGSFREWRGFIKTADSAQIPSMIQQSIEKYLQKECQGSSLVTGNLTCHAIEQHSPVHVASHGLFLFNEGDRHGELHVWLFPDQSGAGMGYAICLEEEPRD
jgi:hypothetical protein